MAQPIGTYCLTTPQRVFLTNILENLHWTTDISREGIDVINNVLHRSRYTEFEKKWLAKLYKFRSLSL